MPLQKVDDAQHVVDVLEARIYGTLLTPLTVDAVALPACTNEIHKTAPHHLITKRLLFKNTTWETRLPNERMAALDSWSGYYRCH